MSKSQKNVYEVEAILAEKVISIPERPLPGSIFRIYKVRWKGYGKEHDTWEPEGNLIGCGKLLKEWRARNPIQLKSSRGSSKRKTDAMDIDNGSSGSSSSEKPSKSSRTHPKFVPGTSAYARYRKNLPVEDPISMHADRKKFVDKLRNIPGPPIMLFNDEDSDPCPPVSFNFIERYKITSPDVIDLVRVNREFCFGCSCDEGVCTHDCDCTEAHGMYYDKKGRLLDVNDNGAVINECNEWCSCGIDCQNRVVQRGRKIPLEIYKTEKKGWGLRCPQRIPKGTFIDTYPGELLTLAEAIKRADKYTESGSGQSYLFDLDKFSKVRQRADNRDGDSDDEDDSQSVSPMIQPEDIYVVDGKNYGGVTRFINHSCDPNLLIYAVTRERADYRVYDLAMFASQDIPAYEELTFSYVGDEQIKSTQDGAFSECFCGSEHCKGYLW